MQCCKPGGALRATPTQAARMGWSMHQPMHAHASRGQHAGRRRTSAAVPRRRWLQHVHVRAPHWNGHVHQPSCSRGLRKRADDLSRVCLHISEHSSQHHGSVSDAAAGTRCPASRAAHNGCSVPSTIRWFRCPNVRNSMRAALGSHCSCGSCCRHNDTHYMHCCRACSPQLCHARQRGR